MRRAPRGSSHGLLGRVGRTVAFFFLSMAPRAFASEFVDLAAYGDAFEVRSSGSFEELGRGVTTCDFNGDGIGDLLVGVPYSNGPSGMRNNAGEIDVFFGRRGRWPALRLSATADVVIYGEQDLDSLGMSVACGDVDGDGRDDIVGGAYLADSINDSRIAAGQLHVVFGSVNPPSVIDLAQQTEPVIYGFVVQGWLGAQNGLAVGDVTGDGLADVLSATVWGLHPITNGATGHAYLVMGRPNWPMQIDLATTCDVRFYGAQVSSSFGALDWIAHLDNDGIAEVVIGAEGGSGPSGSKASAGDVFVLRGRASWPSVMDLAQVPADYRFTGPEFLDQIAVGRGADFGDFDADGTREAWLGAYTADGIANTLSNAGEVLLHEVTINPPAQIDLLDATDWALHSNKRNDRMGGGVRRGDFNGDGLDDLVVEVESGDGPSDSRAGCGEAAICFGPRTFPARLETGPIEPDLTTYGRNSGDNLAVRTPTDINGDGIDEVVVTLAVVSGATPSVVLVSHLDIDGDGFRQLRDNCPLVANPSQIDSDADERGDACELDWDGDGINDAIDCAIADPRAGSPLPVEGLAFAAPSKSDIIWSPQRVADAFDISRGRLPRTTSTDYGACQTHRDANPSDTLFVDTDSPASGSGFFYLVRARDAGCGGAGSWGQTSAGLPRQNDNPLACP